MPCTSHHRSQVNVKPERQVNRTVWYTTVFVLVLTLPFPTQTSAQQASATHCGDPEWGCSTTLGSHYLCGDLFDHTYANEHCVSCRVCTQGWEICHPTCEPEFASNGDREAYEGVLTAAAEGDVSSILALAPRVEDHVVLNRDRWAVQVLDCRGEAVIANLPLKTRQVSTSDGRALLNLLGMR